MKTTYLVWSVIVSGHHRKRQSYPMPRGGVVEGALLRKVRVFLAPRYLLISGEEKSSIYDLLRDTVIYLIKRYRNNVASMVQ